MKSIMSFIPVALLAMAITSCSQFSEETLHGTWTIDSLAADNITEYATILSEKNLEEFENQAAQINMILDTIAEGSMKEQLEMNLQHMEAQKDEMTPEIIKKEIIQQNKEFAGNFMMNFASNYDFHMLSKDKDTLQAGSWEMKENYIITTIPRMPEPDTMYISSADKQSMTLSQENKLTEDFFLQVHYYLTKE